MRSSLDSWLLDRIIKIRWWWDIRHRKFYYHNTADNPKFNDPLKNHNVGCLWWAPADKCICEKIRKQYGYYRNLYPDLPTQSTITTRKQ